MLIFTFNMLFLIGLFGSFLHRKNIIILLLALELLFLSINLNIVNIVVLFDNLLGYIYVLSILTIAAAEVAIGLALLVLFYRIRGGIVLDFISLSKG
jgi:NADH-quinone oxidoreductase subunit K